MKPTDPTPPPHDPSRRQPQPHAAPARRPGLHGGHSIGETGGVSAYDDGVPRHHQGPDDPLHNPETAHEHSDVNIRAIVTSAIILFAVGAAAHLAMWLLFGWFERGATTAERPASPVARPATTMPRTTNESPVFSATGTGPQLLTNEFRALEIHRAEERKRLEGYGWVDQNAGVAHMPIEEAKKRLIERGLPVRPEGEAAPTLGTRLPARGEASGGRIITMPAAEPAPEAPSEAPPQQEQQPQPPAKPHGGGH
jgi:hypothetical protein